MSFTGARNSLKHISLWLSMSLFQNVIYKRARNSLKKTLLWQSMSLFQNVIYRRARNSLKKTLLWQSMSLFQNVIYRHARNSLNKNAFRSKYVLISKCHLQARAGGGEVGGTTPHPTKMNWLFFLSWSTAASAIQEIAKSRLKLTTWFVGRKRGGWFRPFRILCAS